MHHTDEAILKAKKQMEQREQERHSDKVIEEELKQSIYDDVVTIFHIPVCFRDRELLDGRITMRLPEDFTPCSQEEIDRVFFLGNRPQYVYTNSYLDFALALNWTEHQVSDGAVFEFAKYMKYLIERVGPQSKILSEEKLERKEGNLMILKLLSNALDGVNHTTFFFTSVENRLLMGTVAFDQRLSKRLAPVTEEMVKSICVRREEDGDGNNHL